MKNCVKELRVRKGWNQNELAKIVGVSRQTISLIEREKFTPSVLIASKIAKVFSKCIEDVFIIRDGYKSL